MPGRAVSDRRGLVAVAHVAKAHGIRGELSMDIYASSPLLFEKGRTLFVAAPVAGKGSSGKGSGRPKPFEVTGCREHTGRLLLTLSGINDRTQAEALRGAEVFISEADLPPPDAGEEYLHRLIGSRVLLADGSEVGAFEAILDTPGQLTWVIRAKSGAEILFPAVPEFILGLDAAAGLVRIDPPPGLIELYLEAPKGAEPAEENG